MTFKHTGMAVLAAALLAGTGGAYAQDTATDTTRTVTTEDDGPDLGWLGLLGLAGLLGLRRKRDDHVRQTPTGTTTTNRM